MKEGNFVKKFIAITFTILALLTMNSHAMSNNTGDKLDSGQNLFKFKNFKTAEELELFLNKTYSQEFLEKIKLDLQNEGFTCKAANPSDIGSLYFNKNSKFKQKYFQNMTPMEASKGTEESCKNTIACSYTEKYSNNFLTKKRIINIFIKFYPENKKINFIEASQTIEGL